MDAVEKEARRLVADLLTKSGYVCSAQDMIKVDGCWSKLPGLLALVTELLKQDKFVLPADPDELAVWEMEAGRPNRWREDQSIDMVKEYWPDMFSNLLRLYRAGKAAANG